MDEIEIKTKLDALAEYQAQSDLMEANKRALLDEVKIPAEVEAIVGAGMKQMSEVEMSFIPTLNTLLEEANKKLAEIVVPEEIKAALAEIDRQRALVTLTRQAQDAEIRQRIQAMKTEIQAKVEKETKGVYTALAQRKAEIEAEFAGKAEAVDENIKKLTDDIKANIKLLGCSVKGERYQGVYVSGRVTWDPKSLDGYAVGHPEILHFRKEGEPSVSIRRI